MWWFHPQVVSIGVKMARLALSREVKWSYGCLGWGFILSISTGQITTIFEPPSIVLYFHTTIHKSYKPIHGRFNHSTPPPPPNFAPTGADGILIVWRNRDVKVVEMTVKLTANATENSATLCYKHRLLDCKKKLSTRWAEPEKQNADVYCWWFRTPAPVDR